MWYFVWIENLRTNRYSVYYLSFCVESKAEKDIYYFRVVEFCYRVLPPSDSTRGECGEQTVMFGLFSCDIIIILVSSKLLLSLLGALYHGVHRFRIIKCWSKYVFVFEVWEEQIFWSSQNEWVSEWCFGSWSGMVRLYWARDNLG